MTCVRRIKLGQIYLFLLKRMFHQYRGVSDDDDDERVGEEQGEGTEEAFMARWQAYPEEVQRRLRAVYRKSVELHHEQRRRVEAKRRRR